MDKDNVKLKYRPSAFRYFLPSILLELLFIFITMFVFFHKLRDPISHYHHGLSMIISFALIIFASMLLLDIFNATGDFILGDLACYLQHDFRMNDYKYCLDYAYYEEIRTYYNWGRYNISRCSICLDELNCKAINGRPKQLLFCGHLYHKSCIEEFELKAWEKYNNDNNDINHHHSNSSYRYPYPICFCPFCKRLYHVHFEKYNFNPNYNDTLPFYHKWIQFPGAKYINDYIWKDRATQFLEYSGMVWQTKYPYKFHIYYN